MIETMRKSDGAGLAAPQIGLAIRFVVMDPDRTGSPYVMVNPILNGIGQAMKWHMEKCLSCGGGEWNVRRRKSVSVEWIDTTGNYRTKQFRGWAARVVQHELSHLEGEVIADIGRRLGRKGRRG